MFLSGPRRGAPTVGACELGQGRNPAAISSHFQVFGSLVAGRFFFCATKQEGSESQIILNHKEHKGLHKVHKEMNAVIRLE